MVKFNFLITYTEHWVNVTLYELYDYFNDCEINNILYKYNCKLLSDKHLKFNNVEDANGFFRMLIKYILFCNKKNI